MPGAADIAHQLVVAARLLGRAARRRLGAGVAQAEEPRVRASLEAWLRSLPPGLLQQHALIRIPATQPPWHDTGIDLAAGDTVTLLARGRVYLSRALDIWVGPAFQLWCRVGDKGPVFRGTRDTHTFTAQTAGRLWLASYFPGEWADPTGRLATPEADYAKVSGGLEVLVLHWSPEADAPGRFREWTDLADTPEPVRAEARRLAGTIAAPEHWDYLWLVGPGEIYRSSSAPDGRPAIACRTHADAGILRREARLPLLPGTRLEWSWRVDELPTDLAEDTLPSHDYVSIAVEFDDGQDLTYYWSAALPVGTVYRCPIPAWKHRETHVVVRSGREGLGRWMDETRDLHGDYRRILGGPAREVTRVWLIANSLFQRGHGRCEYASIRLTNQDKAVRVL